MNDSNILPEELRKKLYKEVEAISSAYNTRDIDASNYVKNLKTLEKNFLTALKKGLLKDYRDKLANQVEVSKKLSEVNNTTIVSSRSNDSRRPMRAAAIKAAQKNNEVVNEKFNIKLRRPSVDDDLPPKRSVRSKNKQYAAEANSSVVVAPTPELLEVAPCSPHTPKEKKASVSSEEEKPQVIPPTKKLSILIEKLPDEFLSNYIPNGKEGTEPLDRSSGYSSKKSLESEKKRSRSQSEAEDEEARLEVLLPAEPSLASSPDNSKKIKKNEYSSATRTPSPLTFKLVIDLAEDEVDRGEEVKKVEEVEPMVVEEEAVEDGGETRKTRTKAKEETLQVFSPSPLKTRKARTKVKKKEEPEVVVAMEEVPAVEDVENKEPEGMDPPEAEAEQSSRPARTKVIKKGPIENHNLPVIDSPKSPMKKVASPVRTRTKVREMAKKIEESSVKVQQPEEVIRPTVKRVPDTVEGKEVRTNNSKVKGVHEWDSCRKGTPLQTNNRIYTPISSSASKPHMFVTSETKSKTLILMRSNEERKRKEEEQVRKLKKEEDARRKREEKMKQLQEETRRKREEKIQKAMAAREAVEREREEALARQEREREERDAAARLEKARAMEEMALKKRQLNLTKAHEAEERRLKEEQARQQRLKEQEEEQRRLAEIRLKQHEEAEKLFQQRQVEELRLKEAQKKQKLQMEKLKAKALAPEACVSYEMTPPKSERTPLQPKTDEDYGIDDIGSDDSSDEEANPKKKIPAWASKNLVEMQIQKQSYISLNLRLKYMSCKNKSPDMTEIFGNKLPKRVRTSSAVWLQPMLYK